MITQWAHELSDAHGANIEFSTGWLERFLARYELVLRKCTNKPIHSDAELVGRAANFITHLKRLIDGYGIVNSNIYSLDETALFFDNDRGSTIDQRGATHIPVRFLF